MPEKSNTSEFVVSSVICAAHVDMAIDCFRSAKRFCQVDDPIRFRIHDDGSLGGEDREKLAIGLDGAVEIVDRGEADERMAERLSRYPALLGLRQYYPVALKMLDAPLWDETADEFRFADSDVLFLRPLRDPFALSDEIDAVFMNDRESNYSLRSWQLLVSRGLRLPQRVNSGVIGFRLAVYDLDFLDWFVSRKIHHGIPWVVEQTAWAALAYRSGNRCHVLDPYRVRVMRENEDSSDLAIGHFTARTRHLLCEFVKRAGQAKAGEAAAISLATVPVKRCHCTDLLGYEARRLARRLGMRSRQKPKTQADPDSKSSPAAAAAAGDSP